MASFGLMASAPKFFRQFANASTLADQNGKRKILITIFQRGAMDGLNAVVPFGDENYYKLRQSIAVPAPQKTDGAINLDGYFGLNPALKSLEKFWQSQQMAIVTAVGSPNNTRSHFDAQDYMESATPGVKSTRDGWLNRILQTQKISAETPFRAVSMSGQLPRSLYGRAPSVAMTGLSDFSIKAGVYSDALKGGFEGIYQQNLSKDDLSATGKETFEALEMLKTSDPSKYAPENGAVYPNTRLGNSLKQIAQLIKANVGLEIAFAEMGGWDTHVNQGASRGQLANLLRDFGSSIAALTDDLGKKMDDVVILTMSEFGRTARENGSRGTDHGHANSMFVIGNNIKGSKVYGDWKGLADDKLYEGRDLDVTTDFRTIFAEIAAKHLKNESLSKVFPGFDVAPKNFRNFLK